MLERFLRAPALGDVRHHGEGSQIVTCGVPIGTGLQQHPELRSVRSSESELVLGLVGQLTAVAIRHERGLRIGVHEGEDRFSQHLLKRVTQHVGHPTIDERRLIVAVNDPHAFEGRFDDPSVALFTGSECLRCLPDAAHIACDAGGRDHRSTHVGERREADGNVNQAPVPSPADGLELSDLLAANHPIYSHP